MAELRRSRGGSGRRPLRQGGASSRRAGSGGSRKISSRPGSIPRWATVAMVAVPAALILVLLAINTFRGHAPDKPKPTDPNAEINQLTNQIPSLEKGYREAYKLLQAEDPRGKAKFKEVSDRLYAWIGKWDTLFDSKRDENDRLPAELQGYSRVRSKVNMMLVDLSRISPMD